ncbi:hypothetical protein [Pedobacter duraquae]|uniref:hypothetical protein n=1 Tax=Pedobacter duraquae TaxID=425511 RepID=UPI001061F918|nr:hypothetical protein [Pedobacter duraquae]
MNLVHPLKNEASIKPDFLKITALAGFLLLLWQLSPLLIRHYDQTAGSIDPSIWLLILLGLMSFLLITGISWFILKWFWNGLGLPGLSCMVIQFRSLELWQQLSFFWASFALLLLAGAMCLIAIC